MKVGWMIRFYAFRTLRVVSVLVFISFTLTQKLPLAWVLLFHIEYSEINVLLIS